MKFSSLQDYAGPAPPSHVDRLKDAAKDEMVHATRQWVRGEMTSSKHSKIHSRARHVLRNPSRASIPMHKARGRG